MHCSESWKVKVKVKAQSCPTLCNPMDYSLPGSSVHSIFQARVPEWVAISFSRGFSQPRDRTRVSLIAGRGFILWATVSTQQMFTDLNLVTDFEQQWWLCTSLHRYLTWITQKGSTLPPARKGYLRVPGFLFCLSVIFSDLPSQMS